MCLLFFLCCLTLRAKDNRFLNNVPLEIGLDDNLGYFGINLCIFLILSFRVYCSFIIYKFKNFVRDACIVSRVILVSEYVHFMILERLES